MALSLFKFREELARDKAQLARKTAPGGLSTCAQCHTPLQESTTGNRPLSDGTSLCSDCYFEEFGGEIDEHPLGAARAVRGA